MDWWAEQTREEEPWSAVDGVYVDARAEVVAPAVADTWEHWSTTAVIELELRTAMKM